ncbi:tubby like protein 8 [Wolffia australiana]
MPIVRDSNCSISDLAVDGDEKENVAPPGKSRVVAKDLGVEKIPLADADTEKSRQTANAKLSSQKVCLRQGEQERSVGSLGSWEPIPSSSEVWYFSDNEAAPASSWSTLPNRSILFMPLPVDVGRCTCIIVKEKTQGSNGVSVYSLYTNEGHGRRDRKLAVAHHKRRGGRSEFSVAQSVSGILSTSDDGFLGTVKANLLGTKYHIWDQSKNSIRSRKKESKLLGVVEFVPTVTTMTGSFRRMRVHIPKQHSIHIKNTSQFQQSNLCDSKEQEKSHQLLSRAPHYNRLSKRYELDYRDIGARASPRIKSSVKNFQLILEKNELLSILQLGRIEKMKFLMEYRYPLTGYQAFCICLASIDSKLCCSL